jgi:hypothetical protein
MREPYMLHLNNDEQSGSRAYYFSADGTWLGIDVHSPRRPTIFVTQSSQLAISSAPTAVPF